MFKLLFSFLILHISLGDVIVSIENGYIRGEIKKNHDGGEYFSFQSIPFAKPPLRELRFKAPQEVDSWQDILNSTMEAPVCPQYFYGDIIGNEDCLYLNVYTPTLEPKKLAVMVYIHGGGYFSGTGSGSSYGPQFLLTEHIVLVTINYRLGILGTLSFLNQSMGIPGNAHLKDQVMALKWIQANIATFGGNKNNVVLFGEGVGGSSVHLHTISPMSKGLLHKAIAQSGTALNAWNLGVLGTGEKLAKKFYITSSNTSEIIEILQQIPIEDLMRTGQNDKSLNFQVNTPNEYGVVVESQTNEPTFLPEPIEFLIQKSKTNIPTIFGYNNKEAILFQVLHRLYTGKGFHVNNIVETIPSNINISQIELETLTDQINSTFFRSREENFFNSRNIIDYMLGPWFTMAMYHTMNLHLKSNPMQRLYFYVFSSDTKLNILKRSHPVTTLYQGASHMDELGYLFTTPNTPCFDMASVEELSFRGVVKLWTNFAIYGNPFHGGSMKWPKIKSIENLNYVLINGTNISVKSNPDKLVFDFWRKYL